VCFKYGAAGVRKNQSAVHVAEQSDTESNLQQEGGRGLCADQKSMRFVDCLEVELR